MNKKEVIIYYPLCLIFDILELIYRTSINLTFLFKKHKYNYENIVAIEYYLDYIMDFENKIFCLDGKYNTKEKNKRYLFKAKRF